MDPGGSRTIISTQIVPHKLSETPIGPEGSGAGPPTQIVTQQPQIFSSVGASPSLQRPLKKFYAGEPLALGVSANKQTGAAVFESTMSALHQ